MPAPISALTRRLRRAAWIAIAAGLLTGLSLLAAPAGNRLDSPLIDVVFRVWRIADRPGPEVVVVGLDQAMVDASPEPLGLIHRELAMTLEAIAAGQPRLLLLDIILPERSAGPGRSSYDLALTAALARAREAGLLIAIEPDGRGHTRPLHPPLLAAAGADRVGLVLYPLDADHAVRRYESVAAEVPDLVTLAAQALERPVNTGWIDWSLGPPFQYVSMAQVVASASDPQWLKRHFSGRVVVVGSVLPFVDRVPQPVHLAAWEAPIDSPPGALLHAQALRTLLGPGFLPAVPGPLLAMLILAFACLAGLRTQRARWTGLLLAMLASLALALALIPAGWVLPLAAPWLAGLVAVALRSALDAREHMREQKRLTSTFGGYVSPQVLSAILSGSVGAGGGRRRLAFLFADLRGFTRLSERAPPDEVLGLLNRYYAAVTPVIHAHGGTIDNFRGDGLMVMFGAPEPMAQPARAALAAALALLDAVDRLNRRLQEEGHDPLQVALGLAAGDAVYGDLGSAERKDYTAIGDAVNVAARLQDLAKEGACRLVASRAALEEAEADLSGFADLGEVPLRGHSPVQVLGLRT